MTRRVPSDVLSTVLSAAVLWALSMRGPAVVVALVGLAAVLVVRRLPARIAAGGVEPVLAVAVAVAATGVAIATAPDSYTLTRLMTFGLLVVALQGLNVVVGFSGQLVMAHVAFLGIGAYTAAILSGTYGWPLILGIAAAGVVAAAVGALLSIPAGRLSGHYLAIASLSLAIVFGPVMKLDVMSGLTGGVQGLSFFSKPFAAPWPFRWLENAQWHAVVVLTTAAAVCAAVAVFAASSIGQAVRAGRDNPLAAASVGVNVPWLRSVSITVSAALGGLSGALLFLVGNRFVSPDAFTLGLMIELLVALMVGGRDTVLGPVLGALFLVFVYREGVERVTEDFRGGSYVMLAVVAAVLALLVAAKFAAPGPRHRRWRVAIGVAVAAGAATIGMATALEGRFAPVALGGLLMGALLIVTVLAVPDGLAALNPRTRRPASEQQTTNTTAQLSVPT